MVANERSPSPDQRSSVLEYMKAERITRKKGIRVEERVTRVRLGDFSIDKIIDILHKIVLWAGGHFYYNQTKCLTFLYQTEKN